MIANPLPPNAEKSNKTNGNNTCTLAQRKQNHLEINKQFKDEVGTKKLSQAFYFLNIIM